MNKKVLVIDLNKEAKCEMCGKVDDLRPYGPNGESICFDCGMKDEETTMRKFHELIADKDVIIYK